MVISSPCFVCSGVCVCVSACVQTKLINKLPAFVFCSYFFLAKSTNSSSSSTPPTYAYSLNNSEHGEYMQKLIPLPAWWWWCCVLAILLDHPKEYPTPSRVFSHSRLDHYQRGTPHPSCRRRPRSPDKQRHTKVIRLSIHKRETIVLQIYTTNDIVGNVPGERSLQNAPHVTIVYVSTMDLNNLGWDLSI